MLMKRIAASLLILLLALDPALAAARFWVGGTGTWDGSATTHWSDTSGGASGQPVPGSGDTVTFDANSGGGTVTVNTTVTVQSITNGAHTGTLDFSANNNNVTLSALTGFSGTGTGTRTLNLGNGIWTLTAGNGTTWNFGTTTNLTFNANSSTLRFTGSGDQSFAHGNLTYSTIDIRTAGDFLFSGTAITMATLLATPQPTTIRFTGSVTHTITNAFTLAGTSSAPLGMTSTTGSNATVSISSGTATCDWCGISGLTFSGGATFSASNSLNLSGNSGITITAPSGGGASGGYVIGN